MQTMKEAASESLAKKRVAMILSHERNLSTIWNKELTYVYDYIYTERFIRQR
jgi:hypothetical protein